MRRKFVTGNWKMHGSMAENKALLDAVVAGMSGVDGVDCAVCVPYPYLSQAQEMLAGTNIRWGAQDVHQLEKGAYTGEVSAEMLKDFGCRYAIVGHSERRAIYGETNLVVAGKFAAAQNARLTPILCVGETLDERDEGQTERIVAAQLDIVIEMCGVTALRNAVLAYEPVWAIGTGKTASPEQAQAVHAFIRQRVAEHDASVAERLIIQYGGSVKPGNAEELFAMPDIDGGLIGGASLVAEDFLAICRAGVN